jgi:hypothetical protein
MIEEPDNLKGELKQLGRLQYHRFRRVAAMLHYYRIDPITIEDRLIERGCSRELSGWIVQSASADAGLAKRMEEAETPESVVQVILKGANGAVTLVIIFLVTWYIQAVDSIGLLFVFGPVLLIGSFIGSLMFIRSIMELWRRWTIRD